MAKNGGGNVEMINEGTKFGGPTTMNGMDEWFTHYTLLFVPPVHLCRCWPATTGRRGENVFPREEGGNGAMTQNKAIVPLKEVAAKAMKLTHIFKEEEEAEGR